MDVVGLTVAGEGITVAVAFDCNRSLRRGVRHEGGHGGRSRQVCTDATLYVGHTSGDVHKYHHLFVPGLTVSLHRECDISYTEKRDM